jgi:hypothetical protein
MSIAAITLLIYVWHYLVARLAYDHLLRPLIHGHVTGMPLICGVAAAGFVIGRWSGRRRS